MSDHNPDDIMHIRMATKDIITLEDENARLQAWVNDLQSGMYVNCVYCGHRYGPKGETPESMAWILTRHVENCQYHPLNAAREAVERLKADNLRLLDKVTIQGHMIDARDKFITDLAEALDNHVTHAEAFTECPEDRELLTRAKQYYKK